MLSSFLTCAPQDGESSLESANAHHVGMHVVMHHVVPYLVFGLFALPCRFLVLPVIRAVLEHKTELLILSLMVMAFTTLPGMVMTPLGITAAVAASLYLAYKLLDPIVHRLMGFTPVEDPQCHISAPESLV